MKAVHSVCHRETEKKENAAADTQIWTQKKTSNSDHETQALLVSPRSLRGNLSTTGSLSCLNSRPTRRQWKLIIWLVRGRKTLPEPRLGAMVWLDKARRWDGIMPPWSCNRILIMRGFHPLPPLPCYCCYLQKRTVELGRVDGGCWWRENQTERWTNETAL